MDDVWFCTPGNSDRYRTGAPFKGNIMLKSVRLMYDAMGGDIRDEIDKEILTSLWKSMGTSDDEIEDLIDNNMVPSDSTEGKIRNIASRVSHKIIAIELIKPSDSVTFSFNEEYGVIYDDAIPATYAENVAIATEQFIMNSL